MSDFNLFSSKTDLKKFIFTTDKYSLIEHEQSDDDDDDSWQDLPGVTPTSIIDNQHLTSTSSHNDWKTIADYSTIPKSYPIEEIIRSKTPPGYCQGPWLLLPQPQATTTTTTTNDQEFFQDSCESLTISVDLHVPMSDFTSDSTSR